MPVPQPVTTPVGASAVGATLGTVIGNLLSLIPWYSTHIPTAGQTAITALLAFLLGYLGGWRQVVSSPGQTASMTLTDSPLPTLQEAPAPESHAATA